MKFSTMAAAAVTALLAGCNLAPVYKTPDLPVPETVSGNAIPAQASEAALQQAQALQWLQSPQLREVVALAQQGKLSPLPVSTVPADQVNDVLNRLKDGKVHGRVVLTAA